MKKRRFKIREVQYTGKAVVVIAERPKGCRKPRHYATLCPGQGMTMTTPLFRNPLVQALVEIGELRVVREYMAI